MSRGMVELDFFGLEKQTPSAPPPKFRKFLDRRRSFRDIQGAISKINPEIVKSVIAAGAPSLSGDSGSQVDPPSISVSVPSTPKRDEQPQIPVLPVHAPVVRRSTDNIPPTGPMTIFYNGTVSIFEVSRDKAESIMKVALEASSKKAEPAEPNLLIPPSEGQKLLQNLEGDLPIARRKSLQRFLEKRKERLTSIYPYSS